TWFPSNPRLKDRARLEGHKVLLDLSRGLPLTVGKEALGVFFAQVCSQRPCNRQADSVSGQEREDRRKSPGDVGHLHAQVDRAFAEVEPPDAVIVEAREAPLEVGLSPGDLAQVGNHACDVPMLRKDALSSPLIELFGRELLEPFQVSFYLLCFRSFLFRHGSLLFYSDS